MSRRGAWALLAALLASLALLAAAGPASAALVHPSLLAILDGERLPGPPPVSVPIEDACGVAVDGAGDVYVADHYHRQVNVYRPPRLSGIPGTGTAIAAPAYMTKIPLPGAGAGPCALAIDAAGRVYVNEWHQRVLRFTPSAYPFPSPAVPSYGPPTVVDPGPATGVAVDRASGRAYVAHRGYVTAYEADGSQVETGGGPLRLGLGSLGEASGLAVSGFPATAGQVYVADGADETVAVYDPASGTLLTRLDGGGTPQGGFHDLADTSLAVDDSNGRLLVADRLGPGANGVGAAVVDEFGRFGGYLSQLPQTLVDAAPSAVAVAPPNGEGSGVIYASSGDDEGATVYGFCPNQPTSLLLGEGLCPLPSQTAVLRVSRTGSGGGEVRSAPLGVACGGACVGEFAKGSTVRLSAGDDGHSAFLGWEVAGSPGACPGTGSCDVALSADREVTARFEALPQQALTVAKAGTGSGTVASQPAGVECGPGCAGLSAEFNAGSTVTLSATAAPHSAFVGWEVASAPGACPGSGPCAVTLGAATTVTAEFAPLAQRRLAVSRSGAGSVRSEPAGIDCGTDCAASFDQGAAVALSARPAAGFAFAGWAGGGCGGLGPCTVSMQVDTAVSATFVPIAPAAAPPRPGRGDLVLAVVLGGAGSGSVQSDPGGIDCGEPCAGAYPAGTTVALRAVADPESRFVGWSGCDRVSDGRCLVRLEGARTVGAEFAEAPPARVAAVTSRGARAVLKVSLPAAGTLTASGPKLRPATVRAGAAGVAKLTLRLSRSGKRALARRGRLVAKAALKFAPADGGEPTALATTVTFKRAKPRGGGGR